MMMLMARGCTEEKQQQTANYSVLAGASYIYFSSLIALLFSLDLQCFVVFLSSRLRGGRLWKSSLGRSSDEASMKVILGGHDQRSKFFDLKSFHEALKQF